MNITERLLFVKQNLQTLLENKDLIQSVASKKDPDAEVIENKLNSNSNLFFEYCCGLCRVVDLYKLDLYDKFCEDDASEYDIWDLSVGDSNYTLMDYIASKFCTDNGFEHNVVYPVPVESKDHGHVWLNSNRWKYAETWLEHVEYLLEHKKVKGNHDV